MNKEEVLGQVLEIIRTKGLENDVLKALSKTSNGFPIYYDEETGKPVGIIYKNFVFLKETLPTAMTFRQGTYNCSKINFNGKKASFLPPLSREQLNSLYQDYPQINKALAEIGGNNLDKAVWMCSIKYDNPLRACIYRDGLQRIFRIHKSKKMFVRPVICLD